VQQQIKICVSSPRSAVSLVAAYLSHHPAGVADLALQVEQIETVVQQAVQLGAKLLQPIQVVQTQTGSQKIACIQGWGDYQHTLIEQLQPALNSASIIDLTGQEASLLSIDHAVLNVKQGELSGAIAWYEQLFSLQRRQNFAIQTRQSALCSQVLTHPKGAIQLAINEPASVGSQIQEFLDWNRGAGIQHLALRTSGIVTLIAHLRQQGLRFLSIPASYYQQVQQRPHFPLSLTELQRIAQQEVLIDWQSDNPQALLLQAFTHPIFDQPTFFFELIERRQSLHNQRIQIAEGFGEGNFQALFEAIEREQMKRGSLKLEG
jgi:4-hydroxyphenylpyruvate dioxygenase